MKEHEKMLRNGWEVPKVSETLFIVQRGQFIKYQNVYLRQDGDLGKSEVP